MYRIVADSSLDMNKDLESKLNVDLVPFKLSLDDEHFIDDENLDMREFYIKMNKAAKLGSACPSPEDFLNKFMKDGDIFAITITSKLSGTFNSALLAKDLYFEQFGKNKKIHVFDSKLASGGETLIAMKIRELSELDLSFEEIVNRVEEYISKLKLYFISEKLDNLIKNGRISRLKGSIATALNIKPLMGTDDGEIILIDKARGTEKAFAKMIERVSEVGEQLSGKVLSIAHADNIERAEILKQEFEKLGRFKEIVILPMKGLSSLYTDHKGIIITF